MAQGPTILIFNSISPRRFSVLIPTAGITPEWAEKCLLKFQDKVISHNNGAGCDYWWLMVPKDKAPVKENHVCVVRDIFKLTETQIEQFIQVLGGKSHCLKRIQTIFNKRSGCFRNEWKKNHWFRIRRDENDTQTAGFHWDNGACLGSDVIPFSVPTFTSAAAAIQRPDPPAVAPAAPAVKKLDPSVAMKKTVKTMQTVLNFKSALLFGENA